MAFVLVFLSRTLSLPFHVTAEVNQYATRSFPPKVTRVVSVVVTANDFPDRPPILFRRGILGEDQMIENITRQAKSNGDIDVVLENPTVTELNWVAKGLVTSDAWGKPFRITLERESSTGLEEEVSTIFGRNAAGSRDKP